MGLKSIVQRYRVTQVIDKLAALATVAALFLAFQATREAAHQSQLTRNQLELARQQAQPSFRLIPNTIIVKLGKEAVIGHDSLSVIMTGSANDVIIDIDSGLYFIEDGVDYVTLFDSWWQEAKPANDEVARFKADPKLLSRVVRDSHKYSDLQLTNIVTIYYIDVFGVDHTKYFAFAGEPFDSTGMMPWDSQEAEKCRGLLGAYDNSELVLYPQGTPYSTEQFVRSARKLTGVSWAVVCPNKG